MTTNLARAGEDVDAPSGVAEEAMKPPPVSVADMATGEDDFGHVAVTLRENPARDDHHEGLVGRGRENRSEFCSRVRKESVISMGRLPSLVSCCDLRNQDNLPRNREEADLFFCSVTPLQKCETRTEESR